MFTRVVLQKAEPYHLFLWPLAARLPLRCFLPQFQWSDNSICITVVTQVHLYMNSVSPPGRRRNIRSIHHNNDGLHISRPWLRIGVGVLLDEMKWGAIW